MHYYNSKHEDETEFIHNVFTFFLCQTAKIHKGGYGVIIYPYIEIARKISFLLVLLYGICASICTVIANFMTPAIITSSDWLSASARNFTPGSSAGTMTTSFNAIILNYIDMKRKVQFCIHGPLKQNLNVKLKLRRKIIF